MLIDSLVMAGCKLFGSTSDFLGTFSSINRKLPMICREGSNNELLGSSPLTPKHVSGRRPKHGRQCTDDYVRQKFEVGHLLDLGNTL